MSNGNGHAAPVASNGAKPTSSASAAPITGPRISGKVKWFDPKKGYGFIEKPPGAEKDIFLHANSLPEGVDDLEVGQVVTFQTEGGKKGVRAIRVEVGK